MKKMKQFSLIGILLLGINAGYAQGTWTQKADFGNLAGDARSHAVGFSIGDKGYVGTGTDGTVLKEDFWEYDPAADTWTQKANFGGGTRNAAVGFSIGDKGYVGTGGGEASGVPKKDFWEYDPGTNSWTQKADFGGDDRTWAVGFSIGSKGYVGTGFGISYALKKDFWEYDPATDTWTQKADLGGNWRAAAVGFSIGSKGYIGAGFEWESDNAPTWYYHEDFWEYNPATDAWTQKAVEYRGVGGVGFSIGNKGYIGTGILGDFKKDFWEYDPVNDSWIQKADFGGDERSYAVGFSIGSKGYVGTGYSNNSGYKRDFWVYSECNIAVSAGADANTYFGLTGEQCAGKTAAITGGIAPFTYEWTLDRGLLLNVNNASETISGENTETVIVCLMDTATLTVTVTDSKGCTASSRVNIYAEDVRCLAGNSGNQKVMVCHGGKSMCVNESALDDHLAHGDILGSCLTAQRLANGSDEHFSILPNPSSGFITVNYHSSSASGSIHLKVIDLSGRTVYIENTSLSEGMNTYQLDITNLTGGTYLFELNNGEEAVRSKITINK